MLKADAIANRDKGKDAYDVVWLLTAWGPRTVAEIVSKSSVIATHRDDVVGQLRRLVNDQFRDTASAGPGLYAGFHGEGGHAARKREVLGAVKTFGAALRARGVLEDE